MVGRSPLYALTPWWQGQTQGTTELGPLEAGLSISKANCTPSQRVMVIQDAFHTAASDVLTRASVLLAPNETPDGAVCQPYSHPGCKRIGTALVTAYHNADDDTMLPGNIPDDVMPEIVQRGFREGMIIENFKMDPVDYGYTLLPCFRVLTRRQSHRQR